MPYIGHNPTQAGSFVLLDDIASGFDGSDVTFTLQIGGVDITPTADNLIIALDGVIQHSPEAYSVSGSTLTFTAAPASGVDFYGMLMGQSASIGQGSIGADELAVTGDGSANQMLVSDGDGTMTWKGSGLSATSATGDLIYRNSSGELARLAVGSSGQVLTVASGVPAWETDVESYLPLSGGTMSGALNMGSQAITNAGTITGTFSGNLTGNVTGNTSGTAASVTGAAQTNITSVGTLTGLTVSGDVSIQDSSGAGNLTLHGDPATFTVNGTGSAYSVIDKGSAGNWAALVICGAGNDNTTDTWWVGLEANDTDLHFSNYQFGTDRLLLDTSGNATFTGSASFVGMNTTSMSGSGFRTIHASTTSKYTSLAYDGLYTQGAQHQYISSAQDIKFYPNGTLRATMASGGTFTYVGVITNDDYIQNTRGTSTWSLYGTSTNFAIESATSTDLILLKNPTTVYGALTASGKIRTSYSGEAGIEVDSSNGNDAYIDLASGSANWTMRNTGNCIWQYEGTEMFKMDTAGYFTITHSAQNGIKIYGDDTACLYVYDKADGSLSGGITFGHADAEFLVYTNGVSTNSEALKIVANNDATFAGDVTIKSTNKLTVGNSDEDEERFRIANASTGSLIMYAGAQAANYNANTSWAGVMTIGTRGGQGSGVKWKSLETRGGCALAVTAGTVCIGGDESYQKLSVLGGNIYLSPGYDITWANGNAVIGESSYELQFDTYNGSALTRALTLAGNNTATFAGSVHIAPSAQIRMPQTDTNRYGAVQVDQTDGAGQGTAQCLRLISKNDYGSIYEQRITMETNGAERFVVEFNGVCSGDLNDTSDVSLKKTIKPIESSLDIIKELNPVSFYWKKGENRGEDKQKGFIAQEVESIIPEVVHGEDGNKSINVTGIVAQLTKALQELSDKVEALDNT